MSTAEIVALVVLGWVVLALVVGLTVGPVLRRAREKTEASDRRGMGEDE